MFQCRVDMVDMVDVTNLGILLVSEPSQLKVNGKTHAFEYIGETSNTISSNLMNAYIGFAGMVSICSVKVK